jgi:hypothetical protein
MRWQLLTGNATFRIPQHQPLCAECRGFISGDSRIIGNHLLGLSRKIQSTDWNSLYVRDISCSNSGVRYGAEFLYKVGRQQQLSYHPL